MVAILLIIWAGIWFAYSLAAAMFSVAVASIVGLAFIGLHKLIRRPDQIPNKVKITAAVISGAVALITGFAQIAGVDLLPFAHGEPGPTPSGSGLFSSNAPSTLPSAHIEPGTQTATPKPPGVQPPRQPGNSTPAAPQPQPSPSPIDGFSGSKDLNSYCKSLGYFEEYTSKGDVGAYDNWKCRGLKADEPYIHFLPACRWAHGSNVVQAAPTDDNSPYTWTCYVNVYV